MQSASYNRDTLSVRRRTLLFCFFGGHWLQETTVVSVEKQEFGYVFMSQKLEIFLLRTLDVHRESRKTGSERFKNNIL